MPWRLAEAEQALRGKPAADESYEEAAKILVSGAKPLRYNGFKVELAQRVAVRALAAAVSA